ARASGRGRAAGPPPARVEEKVRLLLPDEARQRVGEAEAGMEAQPVEIGGEARLDAGDAEVCGEGKAEPASDGRAMDGGDPRLASAEDPCRLLVEMLSALVPRPRGRAVREVRARAEGLALGAQNHGAASG